MSDLFRIALGQMTVAETGTENLAKAVSLMKRAADAGARLLVLPETD
jgi:predicted amidohydrolase